MFAILALAAPLAVLASHGLPQDDAQGATLEGTGEPLTFTHVLDDSPLDVFTPIAGEIFTPEVEAFHQTGGNPYLGDEAAIVDGEALYMRWCQACHMPDGSGRMGPALNDDTHVRERAGTEKGEFEIIYGGSVGAMQAFGDRIEQDGILRLMAFLDTLGAE